MRAASAVRSIRPLAVPILVTAVMFAVLVGLGVWQLQRLQWKTGLLAQIDAAEAAPPVALSGEPKPFTKVFVQGVLRDDVYAWYGDDVRDQPAGPAMGAFLIEPLERPGQDPVLVDRGWVPNGAKLPPGGPGDVVGYLRALDRPGLFSAQDDLAGRHFYTLDPVKIGAALGLARVAPFTLIAMGAPAAGLQPATALPRPPNDHLNYALTWFGLAVSLLAVFGAYLRKGFRS